VTFEQFVATVGIIGVVTIVVEVIKRAAQWDVDTTVRFAPLVAVLLGAVLGGLFFLVSPDNLHTGQNAVVAVLFGLVQGASASGIYDLGSKAVIESLAGPHSPTGDGPATPPVT
jgi:uncharacterized membrane protein